ncbi:hypothetical protein FWH09_00390 [Candidatus Saccharibacteria bacterium]|nr:hypothetical protein [Candidatus Saccharibacteria bacterium]
MDSRKVIAIMIGGAVVLLGVVSCLPIFEYTDPWSCIECESADKEVEYLSFWEFIRK